MSDKLAQLYNNHSSLQNKYGQQLIARHKADLRAKKVLDLGCGTGKLTTAIALAVGETGCVIGVDPDKERIEVARNNQSGEVSNVEFVVGKIHDVVALGPFDVVYSNFALHWVKDHEIEDTMNDIRDCLVPGGLLCANITRNTGELSVDLALMTTGKTEEEVTGMTFRPVSFWKDWCKEVDLFVDHAVEKKTDHIMFPNLYAYFDFVKAYTDGAVDAQLLHDGLQKEVRAKHAICDPDAEFAHEGAIISIVAKACS